MYIPRCMQAGMAAFQQRFCRALSDASPVTSADPCVTSADPSSSVGAPVEPHPLPHRGSARTHTPSSSCASSPSLFPVLGSASATAEISEAEARQDLDQRPRRAHSLSLGEAASAAPGVGLSAERGDRGRKGNKQDLAQLGAGGPRTEQAPGGHWGFWEVASAAAGAAVVLAGASAIARSTRRLPGSGGHPGYSSATDPSPSTPAPAKAPAPALAWPQAPVQASGLRAPLSLQAPLGGDILPRAALERLRPQRSTPQVAWYANVYSDAQGTLCTLCVCVLVCHCVTATPLSCCCIQTRCV